MAHIYLIFNQETEPSYICIQQSLIYPFLYLKFLFFFLNKGVENNSNSKSLREKKKSCHLPIDLPFSAAFIGLLNMFYRPAKN